MVKPPGYHQHNLRDHNTFTSSGNPPAFSIDVVDLQRRPTRSESSDPLRCDFLDCVATEPTGGHRAPLFFEAAPGSRRDVA